MRFGWLKKWMPRSLYGRAALILILPVITLQLVVSIVFIQRHFEGVTAQMTRNVVPEIRYFVTQINAEPDIASAQRRASELGPELALAVFLPAPLRSSDTRHWYDLSGRTVVRTFRERLPGVAGIDLVSNFREVQISVETAHGGMDLRLPRGQVSASNPHQLLVLMIVTGILMTLVSFIFLRNQLRPITRLSAAAEAFGKGRHMSYKPAGASEVRSAGAAFLDMRARIERQIEQRTLMLSGISHDLRTPLTRLRLALSMQDPNEDITEMERDVHEMEGLVDEFLAFVRGDALDEAAVVDPATLINDVVADSVRGGRNVSLGDIAETEPMTLRPVDLARALDNLIGNAVRYGSQARVSLHATGRSVIFRVEDDGPGIPESQVEEAMKPFARLDPSRNLNHRTGAGLGLAIASDIARKHGGSLRLTKSVDLGGLQADLAVAR